MLNILRILIELESFLLHAITLIFAIFAKYSDFSWSLFLFVLALMSKLSCANFFTKSLLLRSFFLNLLNSDADLIALYLRIIIHLMMFYLDS